MEKGSEGHRAAKITPFYLIFPSNLPIGIATITGGSISFKNKMLKCDFKLLQGDGVPIRTRSCVVFSFLYLHANNSHGRRHYVFRLFVHLSYSSECNISVPPSGDFFKCGISVYLDLRMDWLDFSCHRVKVKVTNTPRLSHFVNTISQERLEVISSTCPHGLKLALPWDSKSIHSAPVFPSSSGSAVTTVKITVNENPSKLTN